ncbi:hypothetical protein Slin14017_G093610 [Septoria linicola]|nr:hypothetical protein Slin14017_G093610 [Septoria linicola]
MAYLSASARAQSALTAEHSNTCLKRSVIAYTSESTTYLYLRTTSLPATPSYCANVTTETLLSTVYGSNITVTTTIDQQATTTPSIAPESVTMDYDFELGTAEVATTGPLPPYSGDSYLLITFNNTSAARRQQRRQASTPQVYNVTQMFAALSGQFYTLNAYAAQAANGDVDPDCTLTICAQDNCGSAVALTETYSLYSQTWAAPSTEANAVALYSVQCSDVAYVALDNVTVVASRSPPPPPATVTQYLTRTYTIQQTVSASSLPEAQPATTTITQLITSYISGSAIVFTSYVPTVILSTATTTARELIADTKISSFTTTEQTVWWVTATAIEQVANTKFFNQTVSLVSTTTTTITQTLNATVLPAITATATTTQWVTETFLSGYPVLQDASTTTILSTEVQTTTEPAVTLPQAIYTPLPETQYITVTLEQSTITSYISVTPPPITEYATFTKTPAIQTLSLTETLPQVTETPVALTETLVQTFTPYPVNHTLNVTSTFFGTITETTTQHASSSSPQQPSLSIASGVPTVALASPTAIVGDINGASFGYDDFACPVNLPFPLTLFGQASSQVYVTTNGLVGWNTADGTYSNTVLPTSRFDTAALALWDDLYIYGGTQSSEAFPNTVTYQYLNVSDHGGSATVGVQSRTAGNLFGQYSFNQAIVYSGMQMTWCTSNISTPAASYYLSNPGDRTARTVANSFAGRTWEEAVGSKKTRLNQWLEAASELLKR